MASILSFKIRDSKSSSVKVIQLNGEMDETALDEIKQAVDPLLNDPHLHQLIFDLTELQFINSKGIGYLVSVHTHLAKDGRSMVMTNATQPVMDVITLVGLTGIIPYYPTLEEAESM